MDGCASSSFAVGRENRLVVRVTSVSVSQEIETSSEEEKTSKEDPDEEEEEFRMLFFCVPSRFLCCCCCSDGKKNSVFHRSPTWRTPIIQRNKNEGYANENEEEESDPIAISGRMASWSPSISSKRIGACTADHKQPSTIALAS